MKNYILTLDLGTTEIKFALFDLKLSEITKVSSNYNLQINKEFVEFEAEEYWNICKKGIKDLIDISGIDPREIASISLSSQAETLVVVDRDGKPLRKAISWLDNRSQKECQILKDEFSEDNGYKITGQPDIVTTWPITKILWLKENEKQVFKNACKYLLLKDYIIYKLTGKYMSEYTVYNFSYYFDIINKCYWKEMLDFVGIKEDQLPQLVEPGEDIGQFTDENIDEFNFSKNISLNVGALDQMAGMIGVGNISKGIISETTGTVIAICTMLEKPLFNNLKIPCHYNAIQDSYILLTVCESGGINLGWFKDNLYVNKDFKNIDKDAEKVSPGSDGLVFLPYIAGVNSPEYNPDAKGVFYGINITHKNEHFSRAIMEGVGYLIRKNLDHIGELGIEPEKIISLGGGSKSDVWNQIKADITGREIVVNKSRESTSLGAAILAAVSLGWFKNIEEATKNVVKIRKIFKPGKSMVYRKQYEVFLDIYDRLFR